MALPTVAVNSGTGSDTAASGAGPSTALSGTGAATAASTTVTLLVDNPDLSGVATDGSAVIWVGSSSGRQFAKITGVNNTAGVKTVTVSDAFANTESGKNWGIGGKRSSLGGSVQLGLDVRAGWTIDVQTGETLTANFHLRPGNATAGSIVTMTSTAGTRPLIQTATNSIMGLDIAAAQSCTISNLTFKSTAGTPGDGIGPGSNISGTSNIIISNCSVDGFRNGIIDTDAGNNVTIQALTLERVEVKNCTQNGIYQRNTNPKVQIIGCYIHNNNTSANASYYGMDAVGPVFCKNTVFDSNTQGGVRLTASSFNPSGFENCVFSNTVILGSTGYGLALNDGSGGLVTIKNCIFWNNAKYGVASGASIVGLINENNAYGSNGTADRQSISAGTNDVTLTANPFTSSTDFSLNSTAGGGTACKQAGTSQSLLSATAVAPDIGAVQEGKSLTAAGALFIDSGMTGGIN